MREAEMKYKRTLATRLQEHKENVKNMKEQYEHLLEEKRKEKQKFEREAADYMHQKREMMVQARKEAVDLFEIVKKQAATIEGIEKGKFTNGVLSFNIP